jgi:uncharacterized protein YraI
MLNTWRTTKHRIIAIAAALAVTGGMPAASALAAPAAAVRAQGVELTVTGETANIRSGPSTADAIIGVAKQGAKFVADAKTADGAWFRITFEGKQGYVFAQLVSTGGAAAPAAAPAPAAAAAAPAAASGSNVKVTSATLNVRAKPSTSAAILGQLTQSESVAADAKTADGKWLRITYKGQQAFVWAAYTTFSGTAAPAAAAAAPAAGAAKAGAFEVGAHVNGAERLDMMTDTGFKWIKYQVVVDGGAPDLAGLLGQYKAAGLKVLIGAVGNRGRADDVNYHKEFAGILANIAAQGADAIEVWNEPNLDREYGGSGNGKVNPENYANMLREAYGAIKAANPNTLVIAGAPAPTGYFGGNCTQAGCNDDQFLQRMAATGAAAWMDCQGAHYNGSPNPPDLRSGGPTGDHYSWYFWGTFDMTYNALGGKVPVCFTEMGYVTKDGIAGSLPGGFSWGNNITLANQAEWSARLVTLLKQSGRARIAIFWNWNFRQFNDDPQAGYSLLRPDGSCPSCGAIKAAIAQ